MVELKPQKKNCGTNWRQNGLFYSNVFERPLKLACFSKTYIILPKSCDSQNFLFLCLRQFSNNSNSLNAVKSWNPPKFLKKRGFSDFSHKKGAVVKIWIVLKKEGYHLFSY